MEFGASLDKADSWSDRSNAIFASIAVLLFGVRIRLCFGFAWLCGCCWRISRLLKASINVTEISIGLDDISDSVLQFLCLGEAAINLAIPQDCVCHRE